MLLDHEEPVARAVEEMLLVCDDLGLGFGPTQMRSATIVGVLVLVPPTPTFSVSDKQSRSDQVLLVANGEIRRDIGMPSITRISNPVTMRCFH